MITEDDEALLKVYAGIYFHPGATVTLPSGTILDADEANALTSFYVPAEGPPDRTPPEHLANCPITVTLAERARQMTAHDQLEARLKDAQAYGRQMWIVAVYFAAVASIAVGLLLGFLLTR